ncbi:MAG: methyltransferase domain-containing protein [Spirochaetia bacterium]|jgi:ubiquinone/menaquinone biosynthesis C-methylase UbiE
MNTADHVALLRGALQAPGGAWADLGSGSGAFTLALAELLGPEARIWSVDSDARSLRVQERELAARFPLLRVQLLHADFNDRLDISGLDGIVMANSLHFQKDACAVLSHVSRWLKPGGRIVVVEYDIETPNPWVPYPLPFSRLPAAAACARLSEPRLLDSRPSRYHRRVYSAFCEKPALTEAR